MIFSKDLLFLHVPKTGGMSVTDFLLRVLPRPVFYSHPDHEAVEQEDGVVHLTGTRHEDLERAAEVVVDHGFTLDSFPMILAAIRNPYAVEVSRYFYLKAGHPWDFGPEQTLALTRSFVTFVTRGSGGPDLSRYFFLDREIPRNLRILRFETLGQSLPAALEELEISVTGGLPHKNRSRHADFQTYYTTAAEAAVYRRHRWLFDLALYDRLTALPDREEAVEDRVTLPIVGPVHQVGEVSGYWPDLWAGPTLSTTLEARDDVALLELQGYVPEETLETVELVAEVDSEPVARTRADAGARIRWEIPIARPVGSKFDLRVRSSATQRPGRNGGADSREIALQVIRMFFRKPVRRGSK